LLYFNFTSLWYCKSCS